MSYLAPLSVASPWGSAPAWESALATFRPPLSQVKLMSTWVPGPVWMQNASKPVETFPLLAFMDFQVVPRSSPRAQSSKSPLVPNTASALEPW